MKTGGARGDAATRDLTLLLEIQRDLAAGLLECGDLMDCLDLLLSSALRLPGFDCGGIYVYDDSTGELRLVSHRGLSADFVAMASGYPAHSTQARLVREGRLVYAKRSDLPEPIAAAIAAEGLEALAVLPLRDRGNVIAALNVSSHHHSGIEPPLITALESLVAQAEGGIGSVLAREGRILAERRLRLAVEGAQLGTWAADFDRGTFEASGFARELHGMSSEEPLTVQAAMDCVHPDDREMTAEALRRAISEGGPLSCTYRTVASGGTRWLASDARFSSEGGHKLLYGIVRDITRQVESELALIESRNQLERRVAERTAELEAANAELQEKTERIEATHAALSLSERKYRELHESMMDAFVRVELDGPIIESNRSYQEMLGYSHEELCQLSYIDLTPEKWHAMEAAIVRDQILARGFSDLYEKEYRRKDGSVFPVELRAFMLRDGKGEPSSMWGIARDITERKLAEQTLLEWNQTLERRVAERTAELQASEARFRQLAEATFEGIAVTENGILVDGNPQLARLHGYDLSEMIGRPVMDFIAPESRKLVAEHIREGYEEPYECFGVRKDGSTFPSEVHACMRTWHGTETRVTALRDLTSIKEAAMKLHALQTELEHAHKLSLVSEVSAGIVHQIGQPLCGMGANLAAVLAGVATCPTQRCGALEIIKDVESDVSRLREIVIHLRALANPGRANRSRFDFNAMIAGILRLLRHEAMSRQVDLTSDLDASLPQLEGDSVQLSQVVLNLVRNAMDACAGSPAESRRVELLTRNTGGGIIELCVRDTGTGISPEVMDGLFSPFFTTKPEGLGMGLRLCRTIVQTHGGSIEALNNPSGCGALFRVLLPAKHTADYPKV